MARVARWNGQTVGAHAFSVAQHALIVEDIAIAAQPDWPSRNWRLAALLHDAPEYVVGDLISPFKTAIGLDYKAFELRLLAAIHARFGVPADLPSDVQSEIKAADRIAAYFEATRLAGFNDRGSNDLLWPAGGLSCARSTQLWRAWNRGRRASAQGIFLNRFRELIERL